MPAPADGVLPDRFFSTSNLPTYVRLESGWRAPSRPRMDCAIVRRGDQLEAIEPRRVKRGELVLTALDEQGLEGVVVHTEGFLGKTTVPTSSSSWAPRCRGSGRSTMTISPGGSQEEKRRGGYVLWITGPALVHSRARNDFEWLIRNGYVQAVLAGNAVAVHDIEAAIFGTTLGMDNSGHPTQGGHGQHMRAINAVRARGIDRRGRRVGPGHVGDHARPGDREDSLRAGRVDSRRRTACRR